MQPPYFVDNLRWYSSNMKRSTNAGFMLGQRWTSVLCVVETTLPAPAPVSKYAYTFFEINNITYLSLKLGDVAPGS